MRHIRYVALSSSAHVHLSFSLWSVANGKGHRLPHWANTQSKQP